MVGYVQRKQMMMAWDSKHFQQQHNITLSNSKFWLVFLAQVLALALTVMLLLTE
jgi:hypothetical protein